MRSGSSHRATTGDRDPAVPPRAATSLRPRVEVGLRRASAPAAAAAAPAAAAPVARLRVGGGRSSGCAPGRRWDVPSRDPRPRRSRAAFQAGRPRARSPELGARPRRPVGSRRWAADRGVCLGIWLADWPGPPARSRAAPAPCAPPGRPPPAERGRRPRGPRPLASAPAAGRRRLGRRRRRRAIVRLDRRAILGRGLRRPILRRGCVAIVVSRRCPVLGLRGGAVLRRRGRRDHRLRFARRLVDRRRRLRRRRSGPPSAPAWDGRAAGRSRACAGHRPRGRSSRAARSRPRASRTRLPPRSNGARGACTRSCRSPGSRARSGAGCATAPWCSARSGRRSRRRRTTCCSTSRKPGTPSP